MLLKFAIFAASIQAGMCLYCFTCNSKVQPKCEDPIDPAWVVFIDCKENFKRTLDSSANIFPKAKTLMGAYPSHPPEDETKATCQKLIVKNGDENVVFRTCSMSEIDGMDTCERHRQNIGNDSIVFCEQCNSRLCNSSDTASVSLLLLLSSIFAILLKN
ncbi:hypothetical protein C0J52_03032 [Blattella germanica]|nr:hypothetical protein C0J52_03032 [Blattella germanica]